MTQTNRFSSTFDSLAELAEKFQAQEPIPVSRRPNLSEVLAEFSPLPRGTMLLGVANDGLPIYLNLSDPTPGPILIAGDPGSGRTRLLHSIARSVDRTNSKSVLEYFVFTEKRAEWSREKFSNCECILSAEETDFSECLKSLVEWAHVNHKNNQTILLLIDNFEQLAALPDPDQALRWLLFRGPARHVWPVVTASASFEFIQSPWLDSFKTRVFCHIEDQATARILTGRENNPCRELAAGSQYAMLEGSRWLPFWIPDPE